MILIFKVFIAVEKYTDIQVLKGDISKIKILKFLQAEKSLIIGNSAKSVVNQKEMYPTNEDNFKYVNEYNNFIENNKMSNLNLFFIENERRNMLIQNISKNIGIEKINYISKEAIKIQKIDVRYLSEHKSTRFLPLKEYDVVDIHSVYPQLITKVYSKPLIAIPAVRNIEFEKYVTYNKLKEKILFLNKPYGNMEIFYKLISNINLNNNFTFLKNSLENSKSWYQTLNNSEEIIKSFNLTEDYDRYLGAIEMSKKTNINQNIQSIIKSSETILESMITDNMNPFEEETNWYIYDNLSKIEEMSENLKDLGIFDDLIETQSNLRYMIGENGENKINMIPIDTHNLFVNINV